MIFSSLIYLLFLPLVVIGYYLCPARFRWIWLTVASVAYYLSFIPLFFLITGTLVIINYFGGRWLYRMTGQGDGKKSLVILVALNVLVLAFFKYFNLLFPDLPVNLYFVDWFYRVDPVTRLIIPLGLSYLTFTVVSYHIEIKRGNIAPERHFGYFSLYLLFFPKIAQGPIERPQKFLPQLREAHSFDYDMISNGLKQIVWGYFKKLVVADRLAIYVNAVYGNSEHHNGTTLLVATVFFAFQIYADFSGYTDIALGSASLFGFKLTPNFNRPYFATSVQDFWNRWHISFSSWLRDYLFLPLAFWFSRKMKKERYLGLKTEKWIYFFAIMITFAVCGVWHGEGLNYLAWGLLFGIFLTVANWSLNLKKKIRRSLAISKSTSWYTHLQVIVTFILVCFTFVFFRAEDLSAAVQIVKNIFTTAGPVFYESPGNLIYACFGILALLAIDSDSYILNIASPFKSKYLVVRSAGYASVIITIFLIGVLDGGQFIYFQF